MVNQTCRIFSVHKFESLGLTLLNPAGFSIVGKYKLFHP